MLVPARTFSLSLALLGSGSSRLEPIGNRAFACCVSAPIQLYGGEATMHSIYDNLVSVLWLGFLLYWMLMAVPVKATERLEPAFSRRLRAAVFFAAIVLLCVRFNSAWLNYRLWPVSRFTFFAGTGITAAGLIFCVWARAHLGRNWSGAVTIKHGHELIVTGPYAIVRHPIYAGLLVSFIGTVMVMGEVRAVLGFLLMTLAHFHKLRLEEKWMRAQFGEKYEAYSSRVAALVPYVL
jgi:protein-S-isoprenylcysteine O-methyltransferase Ste14